MSLLSGVLSAGEDERPYARKYEYVVWMRTGGEKTPIPERWQALFTVNLPYPYYNAASKLTEGYSEEQRGDFARYGQIARPAGDVAFDYVRARHLWVLGEQPLMVDEDRVRFNTWPDINGRQYIGGWGGEWPDFLEAPPQFTMSVGDLLITAGHGSARRAIRQGQTRRARRRYEFVVAPKYNLIYDLRQEPNAVEWGAGRNEFDVNGSPYVLGLPGLANEHGLVVQGYPWSRWPMPIPINEIPPALSRALVAIDDAIEKGLA